MTPREQPPQEHSSAFLSVFRLAGCCLYCSSEIRVTGISPTVPMVACKHIHLLGFILCPSALGCSPQPNACSLKVGRLFYLKLENQYVASYLAGKLSYTRSHFPQPQSQSSANGTNGADTTGLAAGRGRRFSAFGFRLFQPYSGFWLGHRQVLLLSEKKKILQLAGWEISLPDLQPSPDGGRGGALPS